MNRYISWPERGDEIATMMEHGMLTPTGIEFLVLEVHGRRADVELVWVTTPWIW